MSDHDELHVTIDVSDLTPPNWTRADAQAHHEAMLALWHSTKSPQYGISLGMLSAGYSTGVALTDRGRVARGEGAR